MGTAACKLLQKGFFNKTQVKILLQGLDASGKTTMLYKMKLGEVITTIPTIGFNVETVEHKNINITAWDVGGRDKIRPLYRHYMPNTDAVIFMVDSNDLERMDEVREEVHNTVRMLSEESPNALVLVMANKQDLTRALTPEQLADRLQLHQITQLYWSIQGTSLVSSMDGTYEALDWLTSTIARRRAGKVLIEPVNETREHSATYITKCAHSIKNWLSFGSKTTTVAQ